MWLERRTVQLAVLIGACLVCQASAQQPAPTGARPQQFAPIQPPAPIVPFLLTPQEQANVAALLKAWEESSGKVETFSCEFTLFDYDATWPLPPPAKPGTDPNNTPRRIAKGRINFAKPDKGSYQELPEESGECWICDGKSVFTKDYPKKQLIEHRLPAEMQGKLISESPLPFVFGVEAKKLQERYWVRIVTPAGATGQIWVDAFPKRAQDIANYKKVQIILDQQEFLPTAVQIYMPNDDHEHGKKVSKVYKFDSIKRNAIRDRLNDFITTFVAPRVPLGWTHLVEEAPAPVTAQAPQTLQPPAGQPSGFVPTAPGASAPQQQPASVPQRR